MTRFNCYLLSLITLLLFTCPANLAQWGICIVLFTPLHLLSKINLRFVGFHILFLVIALCSAIGFALSGTPILQFIYFLLSTLMWCIFFCSCIYNKYPLNINDFVLFMIVTMISNIGKFFTFKDEAERKSFLRKFVLSIFYGIVSLSFLLIILCFFVHADTRIYDIISTVGNLAYDRFPLLTTCFILAFFPAAFLYGFVYTLENTPNYILFYPANNNTVNVIPYPILSIILTITEFVFFVIQIYYSSFLSEAPNPSDYNFTNIFVIFIAFLIGLFLMVNKLSGSNHNYPIIYYALATSNICLLLVAAQRTYHFVYYFGLWEDRILLIVSLILCGILISITMFFSHNISYHFIRRSTIGIAILLCIILILPKNYVLSEINVSLFLHKYNTQQLEAQNKPGLSTISENDLNLVALEKCGIESVPALGR